MFTGPVDDDIGERPAMASIHSLILSDNTFRGPLPKSVGKLGELQVLKLVNTGLSGTIPVELGDAKELSTILLSKNKLTGAIPEIVLNLKELKQFDVSSNKLKGRIPPHKAIIPASAFKNNPGLCGPPLPPCKRI
jgi:hypothetical protein